LLQRKKSNPPLTPPKEGNKKRINDKIFSDSSLSGRTEKGKISK